MTNQNEVINVVEHFVFVNKTCSAFSNRNHFI